MKEFESAMNMLKIVSVLRRSLKEQLVPPELTTHDPFLVENVTLVAIEISGINEIISDHLNRFEQFVSSIEGIAQKSSAFRLLKVNYNIIILVQGLFGQGNEAIPQARTAIALSRQVTQYLGQKAPASEEGRRWAMAIVYGGPVVAWIDHSSVKPKLEVSGEVVDEVQELVSKAASGQILVSEDFRRVADDPVMRFVAGPITMGKMAYVMERLVLSPLLSQLGDILRTSLVEFDPMVRTGDMMSSKPDMGMMMGGRG
jgi:hypothetical protein